MVLGLQKMIKSMKILMKKLIVKSENFSPKKEVQNILKKFIGYQMQMPPKFSAVKINGKRSYELARNNLEFDMEERKVFIKNIRLLKHENNKSLFYIKCGTGTYIRSLARDIAKSFDGFAHVTKLVRTRYGNFRIKNSNSLEKLIEKESTANSSNHRQNNHHQQGRNGESNSHVRRGNHRGGSSSGSRGNNTSNIQRNGRIFNR